MSQSTFPVELPPSLIKEARRLANRDGTSLDRWIEIAVMRRIAEAETAAEFFKRRGEGGTADGLRFALKSVSNRAPDPGDEVA